MGDTGRLPHYRVYLLRCWQERSQMSHQSDVWRFSLEDTRLGERRGFSTFEALIATLRAELAGEQCDPLDGQATLLDIVDGE